MSRALSLAGFQVTLIGRIWVTPEDRISVDLDNCYGIKKLSQTFDFTQETVYAIYAPNGVMKSSLAQIFQDIANGVPSTDRIFPARVSVRKITDEHGAALAKESIFVVCPYDSGFGHTEKTSALLVDAKLKKEYDQLLVGIEKSKEFLLKALKEQSQSKKDIEKEVSSAFTPLPNEFYTALYRIKKELTDQKETPFAEVQYDKIFDDRVLGFLQTRDAKTAIEGYVQRYNELLAASIFFKKGTFDYYNAEQIAKSLTDNGFFAAKHTVTLNSNGKSLQISNQKELEGVIAKEKEAIIKDKVLRKQFDELALLLQKNATLRDFQDYMLENEAYLSQLANIVKFKQDILKSYLRVHFESYLDLMGKLESAEARKKQIEEEAAKQRTQWEEVIEIFNERFVVPFTLDVKNRTAVMLGHAPMIELGFTYHDGADNAVIEETALLKALSMGERKALYVLHIIFEVQVRHRSKQETVMVIDDIADSFDYQNKYAIIQYLRDIGQDRLFKQIIMTHNFDFFRTINSRGCVRYDNCLMASKNDGGIVLAKAKGIKNAFLNDLKKGFFADPKKKIASIPFLRNLVELREGEDDPTYARLTSLLHCKADSAAVTETQLDEIYNQVFGKVEGPPNGARSMVEIIHEEAVRCMAADVAVNFENKIVLAIAIRIGAEQFMVKKIDDDAFVNAIKHNQTQNLVAQFKTLFAGDTEAIKILDRVVLMTPENIHLNSFMYEPIVDMSDDHLRKLYAAVLELK